MKRNNNSLNIGILLLLWQLDDALKKLQRVKKKLPVYNYIDFMLSTLLIHLVFKAHQIEITRVIIHFRIKMISRSFSKNIKWYPDERI